MPDRVSGAFFLVRAFEKDAFQRHKRQADIRLLFLYITSASAERRGAYPIKINPPAANKPEVSAGRRAFRLHDKVMQVKDRNDINNGDIGYVTGIFTADGDTTVRVDFGDERITEYDPSELDILELALSGAPVPD